MSTLYIKRRFNPSNSHSQNNPSNEDNNFVFNFSELNNSDQFNLDFEEQNENFHMNALEQYRPYEDVIVIPSFLQQIIKASFGKELHTVTVEPIQVTYTLNAAGGYTLEI